MLVLLAAAFAQDPPDTPATPAAAASTAAPEARPWLDLAKPQCRHGFGIAAGTYYGNVDWNAVGAVWGSTASPVFESTCAERFAERSRRAWLGVMSAPFYVQFRATDGVSRHQWATAMVGATWGEDRAFGPYAAFGYAGLGAGAVLRFTDGPAVLDARIAVYGPWRFGAQAMFTYGIVPRRQRP